MLLLLLSRSSICLASRVTSSGLVTCSLLSQLQQDPLLTLHIEGQLVSHAMPPPSKRG